MIINLRVLMMFYLIEKKYTKSAETIALHVVRKIPCIKAYIVIDIIQTHVCD